MQNTKKTPRPPRKPLWGVQAIADAYCDGHKRKCENLIYRGVIPVTKHLDYVMGDPDAIERALFGGEDEQ